MVDSEQDFGEREPVVRGLVGALLCGGRSSRMGANKALLEMRPGVRQLDYALGLLASLCSRVVACTGPSERWTVSLPSGIDPICDVDEASGPMAGVIAALVAAGGSGVMVIACDMPWIDESVLACLLASRNPAKQVTVFAASDGRPEPMCAIYEPAALESLRQCAREGRAGLRDFMTRVPVEIVSMDNPRLLASVNDEHELKDAHRFFSVRE